jgi:hypothetical protein
VVVVMTRSKPGSSWTIRSHNVLLPEPAGPASTSKTGTFFGETGEEAVMRKEAGCLKKETSPALNK